MKKAIKLDRTMPDFLIIGAMKAGTTSFHHYLNQHPDIFMTYIKEPGIFIDCPPYLEQNPYIKSRDELIKLMLRGYSQEKLIGESSAYYTEAPTLGLEAPKNIKEQAPNMKFLYLLRNPLNRIYSHYIHCLELKIYDEDLHTILAKDRTFLECSLYYYQLNRYLEEFPKEQFKIIILEEFVKDHRAGLREIFGFLGVNADIEIAPTLKKYNKSIIKTRFSKDDSKLSKEMYSQLITPIKEDITELEKFLDRSLDFWDLSEEKWCKKEA